MDDIISKIKDRIDIVDLISSYLRLQKSGVNYKARCPFHNEKTGSFFVSPERQIWHCFGCGKGGDAFGFVKEIEGVEFPEALRILATRAGVELQPFSREQQQFQSEKTKLYEITELATKFFEKQLHNSTTGKTVLEYLHDRGMTDGSIKNFRLGWSPDSWNALTDFLTQKYSAQEVQNAGLIIKSDKPSTHAALPTTNYSLPTTHYYDRFRSRITFPIFDISGQAVGFSGRIFGTTTSEETAKYVNTPQTSIYDKSRILYGLDKAKLGIRQNNKCIVVEGNMDVIMSHQAGVNNAVASSGTALTDGHLKIIKRYTDNLDLCFDSDSAGELATTRGVDLALARDFNVGVIAISSPPHSLNEYGGKPGIKIKDPADFVQKYGAEWAEFAKNSKPFMQFFFEDARSKIDITTAMGKKFFTRKLLPFVTAIASKVEQAHWVNEISAALHVKEDVIQQEIALFQPKTYGQPAETQVNGPTQQTDPSQRLNLVEESILSILLKKPELAVNIIPENEIYLSEQCRNLVKHIGEKGFSGTADLALKMSMDIAYLKSQELWKDFEDTELERELKNLLGQSKRQYISAQLERLEYEIKAAEKAQNKIQLAELVGEFTKISKELGN
ncbi:MAG: DNA primase [Minisyncoccia bacterium]